MITYNHEKYIKEAIIGVLTQQCEFNVEFIIGDDCSPDKTETVVQQLKRGHPNGSRIIYTRHNENKGMMSNVMWAMQQCRGKYIAFCEGDDYWTDPLKLQKQVDFLEKYEGAHFCFTDGFTFDGIQKNDLKKTNFKTGIIDKFNFIQKGPSVFMTASVVVTEKLVNNLIKSYNKEKFYVGDFPLMLEAALLGDIGYVSDKTTVYRVNHEESWSWNDKKNKNKKDNILKSIKILNFYKKKKSNKDIKKALTVLSQNYYGYLMFTYLEDEKSIVKQLFFYSKNMIYLSYKYKLIILGTILKIYKK